MLTPNKFDHTEVPSAACSYIALASSQVVDSHTEVIGWNALGGANRWIPPKGSGIECHNSEQIAIFGSPNMTPQAMSISVITEED